MERIVEVRGLKIGEGIPKVCIPIVGKSKKDILTDARGLSDVKFDLVEWRLDFYEDINDIDKVKDVLKELRVCLGQIPILVTFRSKNEGGERDITIDSYVKLYKNIISTTEVDLVDVELFTGDEVVKEIVNYAHENNVKVVMSNHDFEKTPVKEEIVSRLCKMQELNADLPKIAVMPKDASDVLTLLCATNEMVNNYADRPIITMSMAGCGIISRISGEIFGSSLTFGAYKSVSAPGQISVDDLNKILEIVHENK